MSKLFRPTGIKERFRKGFDGSILEEMDNTLQIEKLKMKVELAKEQLKLIKHETGFKERLKEQIERMEEKIEEMEGLL